MVKVCHLTSGHSSTDVRIFERQCTSLAKAGYDTYLVAQGDTYTKNGVHIVGVPKSTGGRLGRIIKGSRAVYSKALEIDADIYQLHDPELLMYALKLKSRGKRVIFDSHEFYGMQIREKTYIPKIIRNLTASLYMLYEKYVNQRIDATIEVCTLMGKDYFEGRCHRRVFVNNVCRLDEFQPSSKIPFEQRKSIVCIGKLSPSRGITHLIKGVAKTKATLILGGNFISKEYQAELRAMPEYSCVDYRGFITPQQAAEALDGCLVGMATLLHVGQYPKIDTLPTKVYEYMAMGLPVIISDSPYAVKMINKYKFGIAVDPSNPDQIAEAINYLVDHPEKASEMGQNGRRAAVEEFNWGIEEKNLFELYQDLEPPLKDK